MQKRKKTNILVSETENSRPVEQPTLFDLSGVGEQTRKLKKKKEKEVKPIFLPNKKDLKFDEKSFKTDFVHYCLVENDLKLDWAAEIKIMNKLCSFSSDPAFWRHAKVHFFIPSLAWFLTENGKKYLIQKMREFKLTTVEKADNIEIGESKVGEDFQMTKKPKNTKDFLKN
jgi:hypothetical protein